MMYLALGLSIAAIALALCAIAVVSIYSQQITHGSNYDRNPSSKQNNANAGAVPDSGNDNTDARQNTKNNKNHPVGPIWQWLNEREGAVTALSTVFLTVFTFALFGATIGLYLTGEKSAQAAKDSADAVGNVERPYIFIFAKPVSLAPKDGPNGQSPQISYTVTNMGRVPAVVRLIYSVCKLVEKLDSQQTVDAAKVRLALTPIPAGRTMSDFPVCTFEKPITAEDWADIRADRKMTVFEAIFAYEGALDFTYITSLACKIDLFSGRAFAIGGAAHNYDQKQQGRISETEEITLPKVRASPVPEPPMPAN